MKQYFLLIILTLLILPIITINHASGQLINNPDELQANTEKTALTGNLSNVAVGTLAARGVQTILSLLGIIFLGLTLTAGFQWMTAGGNEDQISKAQKTLKAAIIGLIIVIAAYTITFFIFKALPFGMGSVGGPGSSG